VGCGLLGAGSHFMVASETPERQEKVLQYDTTVQEWNDIKREQFAASTFSLKATVPGMGTKSMPLLEDTSDDHAIVDKDGKPEESDEIAVYTPMKYQLGDTSSFANVRVNFTDAPPPVAQFVLTATYKGVQSQIPLDSFDVRKGAVHHVYGAVGAQRQRCTGMHGNMDRRAGGAGGCTVYQRLQSICVEVELDSNNQKWQLRHRNDHHGDLERGARNYGCDPMAHWQPATYEYLKVSGYSSTDYTFKGHRAPGPSTLAGFTFFVRSAADPFLELEALTDNTYYFGLSQHQQRVTAGVMIGIGLLVCISPLLWLYQCVKSERAHYKHESEPFTFYDVSGRSNGAPVRNGDGSMMSADQYVEAYLANKAQGGEEFATRDEADEVQHSYDDHHDHHADREMMHDGPLGHGSEMEIELGRMDHMDHSPRSGDDGGSPMALADLPDADLPSPSAGKLSDTEQTVAIDIESKAVSDDQPFNGQLLQRKRI